MPFSPESGRRGTWSLRRQANHRGQYMKIVKVEDLHADGGWRVFSFLKITTDHGVVGWSEFNESSWNGGLTLVIRKLAQHIIGQDPREVGRISAMLTAITRMAPGG